MTITIKLPNHLAKELQTICYLRLSNLHAEHERALARKDGNQHALLRIIQQQRSDAYDLYNEVSQAVREASPSTETI